MAISGQSPEGFVRLRDLDSTFVYDLKYATEDNFLRQQAYDCGECVIRHEVALALIQANAYFRSRGYRIKFFDCYRPLDVQKIMWSIVPDARYVADPAKGSVHNRGGAVDITLVTLSGEALDMGTGFDHFGEAAHHGYQQLGEPVKVHRKLLKEGMEAFGFEAIATEWRHYNFGQALKYPLSNFRVECED